MAATTTTPFPTINVVPAGFRWSAEAAQKAAAKGAFLRVGGPAVTRRFLSGANRSWANADPSENQTIFNVQYRITGTPENVRTALRYANVPDEQIQAVINESITRDNWQTTRAADVAAELARREATKGAKPLAETYDWAQILWFAQNLKTAVIATKTGEQRGAVTSPGRAGAGESLADKLNKLAAGKVLDVSNMDIQTGKGVRAITAPKTAKSGKFGTGTVRIISNNIEKYIRALELAYGPDGPARYANDVQVVRQALANAGAAPVLGGQVAQMPAVQMPSPGTARMPSPTRVPGATLASPVQFQPAAGVPRVASPTRLPTQGGTQFPAIPALGGLLRPGQ